MTAAGQKADGKKVPGPPEGAVTCWWCHGPLGEEFVRRGGKVFCGYACYREALEHYE